MGKQFSHSVYFCYDIHNLHKLRIEKRGLIMKRYQKLIGLMVVFCLFVLAGLAVQGQNSVNH